MTWFLVAVICVLGVIGQYLYNLTVELAGQVTACYEWIDDIIEALENPIENEGNEEIDKLISLRKD